MQKLTYLDQSIEQMFPHNHDSSQPVPPAYGLANMTFDALGGIYQLSTVKKQVESRLSHMRYVKWCDRAEDFLRSHRVEDVRGCNDEALTTMIQTYAVKKKWTAFKVPLKDIEKIKDEIRKYLSVKCLRTFREPSFSGIVSATLDFGKASTLEFQQELVRRCRQNNWPGVCKIDYPGMGRGITSLKRFTKNEVILDYHGHAIDTKESVDEYVENDSDTRDETYIVEMRCNRTRKLKRRLVDASSEDCPLHPPQHMCLGRLANHATENEHKKYNWECNMKLCDVVLDKLNLPCPYDRILVLVARHNIDYFEHLRWDYKDKRCQDAFSANELSDSEIPNAKC